MLGHSGPGLPSCFRTVQCLLASSLEGSRSVLGGSGMQSLHTGRRDVTSGASHCNEPRDTRDRHTGELCEPKMQQLCC